MCVVIEIRTSMVRSSSILTALPKMNMNCIRFENSQQFLIRCSRLSCGPGDSISALPRLREDMAAEVAINTVVAYVFQGKVKDSIV